LDFNRKKKEIKQIHLIPGDMTMLARQAWRL